MVSLFLSSNGLCTRRAGGRLLPVSWDIILLQRSTKQIGTGRNWEYRETYGEMEVNNENISAMYKLHSAFNILILVIHLFIYNQYSVHLNYQ